MSIAHILVPFEFIRLKWRHRQNEGIAYPVRPIIHNGSADVRAKGTFSQISSLTSVYRSNRSRHRSVTINHTITVGTFEPPRKINYSIPDDIRFTFSLYFNPRNTGKWHVRGV
ncbi:hypothetical protein BDF20DRAFT_833479 [Mycotypha africana]|uniref:uncharacterized protein n=1 Tax=Mycotypha africana TaxID=64632 RepID=UPI002300F8C3|nr:uncharacterized protein BDF20DRAFT_833479 [Mycotypha africana]KAI8983921.1 hypothetical protein BDF20DRAFT_833479 [Mycotypha africana]